MKPMSTPAEHRMIPKALDAAQKLSPETLQGLKDFYKSEALTTSTDKGAFDPAKQRASWIKSVLKESSEIAEACISRLLWHHGNDTIRLANGFDLRYIVGLMHFEKEGAPLLNREQESALLKLGQTHSRFLQAKYGLLPVSNVYGEALEGVALSDYVLAAYVLEHPERANDIRTIVRDRKIIETEVIIGLAESLQHTALDEGVL